MLIYFLIISAGVGWAFFALFSEKFNHLDNIEKQFLKDYNERTHKTRTSRNSN